MEPRVERRGVARELLAQASFVRLWLIGGLANAMRWLELLASALFAYQITGSGFAAAAVTAARTLPLLLFGALAGAVSEATNRQHILVGGLIFTGFNALVVTALDIGGTLDVGLISISSFLSGIVWASEMSTRRRMVGEAAGHDRVVQAIAFDSVTGAGTRLVGPVLGGLAFELVGVSGAYALSGIVQLFCAMLASGLGYRQMVHPLRLGRMVQDIAGSLRFGLRQPQIVTVFAITVVMNMFGFSFNGLIAPIGRGTFEVSPTLVGVLAAAEPLGAILGGMALASGTVRLPPRQVFIGGTLAFFVALIGMALSPSYWLAVAVLVAGGIGTAGFGNMQTSLILTESPPEMRSRLMGIVSVCIGTGPLGVLLAGALSDRIGPTQAVLAMAIAGAAITLLIAVRVGRRRLV
jgi:MFS family permease